MNLTTSFPRSAREKMAGVVMLARTTDKAKAKSHGDLGEYHYNCPMDAGVFSFLGIDHEAFLKTVANAKSDADVEAYVRPFVAKKSADEIEGFNAGVLAAKPAPGSESEAGFLALRSAVAPERTDVTTWVDVLDLDEKRSVPQRVAAAAAR